MLIYLFEKTTSAGSLHKLALQISRVQWPWFYFQLREIIRIFKINKKKEMFVNDSQKISKDKMRMWSTNMSKPEKPPENAFNYQTKRSWTPKVIKVSLFPSIDCPTGSKDQLPNSSSSSGEKETKRCLHLVSWTYSTPFCNIKSILWGSLTTSAAGISLTINKQKMKTAKKKIQVSTTIARRNEERRWRIAGAQVVNVIPSIIVFEIFKIIVIIV